MKTPRVASSASVRTAGAGHRASSCGIALAALALLAGCQDSFLDQSVVGRWERTPLRMPILDDLDMIEQPGPMMQNVTQVTDQDLVPDVAEYVIGPADYVTVTILDWPQQGGESAITRQVNELGQLRLPEPLGPIDIAGLSPSQAERRIAQELVRRDILREEPPVSVIVQEGRQRTFKLLGELGSGVGTGEYEMPAREFRLLDAMALARATVPPQVKTLYIYRPVQLVDPSVVGTQVEPGAGEGGAGQPGVDEPRDTPELIESLMEGLDQPREQPGTAPGAGEAGPATAPGALETTLDPGRAGAWVNVEGRWVRVDRGARGGAAAGEEQRRPVVTQRVIEVPYDRLREGDMSYNLVVRPGDMIRVPAPEVGLAYMGGFIARPGAYTVPGERQITLKQLIFSAGGFGPLGQPTKVDLIRRIGDGHEATVRLDARAIFEGRQPDFFIKPNDTINVGTEWWITPLAVFRNGFRASYGFGFILDRNFGSDVFGTGRLFD